MGGCERAAGWIGRFGGQYCGLQAVGWAWMSWVAGLSSEQGFARFQDPAGIPDGNLAAAAQLTRLFFGKAVGG